MRMKMEQITCDATTLCNLTLSRNSVIFKQMLFNYVLYKFIPIVSSYTRAAVSNNEMLLHLIPLKIIFRSSIL